MKRMRQITILFLLGLLSGCQTLPPPYYPLAAKVRFLLTFDDGPSVSTNFNPTLAILEQLKTNDIQPNIKAIFFVQTRNRNGGGTSLGKKIMRRMHEEGHILGVHSGTPAGHVGHLKMSLRELDGSLLNSKVDIRRITSADPIFVRPPHWRFTPQTHALYTGNDLLLLLSDVRGRDGIIHVFDNNPFRVNLMYNDMRNVRRAIDRGQLPEIDGCIPVTMTLHDVNAYTARHFMEYLRVLLEATEAAGLMVDAKPFYDQTHALNEAAKKRAVAPFDYRPPSRTNTAMQAKNRLEEIAFSID